MDIVGVRAGVEVLRRELPHGAHPTSLLASLGWRATGATDVKGRLGNDLRVQYAVEPAPVVSLPEPAVLVDPGLELMHAPVRRQRVAAYAFVSSDRGWLLTQLSGRTNRPREWTLPGGGMDVGEAPDEALHREIWEETAQEVTLGDLLTVVTGHWVGRSPSGVVQDFHAVRLVYRATCAAPSDPRVIEVGGSTEAAGWFSAQKVAQLPVVDSWADVLPQVTGVVPTSW